MIMAEVSVPRTIDQADSKADAVSGAPKAVLESFKECPSLRMIL